MKGGKLRVKRAKRISLKRFRRLARESKRLDKLHTKDADTHVNLQDQCDNEDADEDTGNHHGDDQEQGDDQDEEDTNSSIYSWNQHEVGTKSSEQTNDADSNDEDNADSDVDDDEDEADDDYDYESIGEDNADSDVDDDEDEADDDYDYESIGGGGGDDDDDDDDEKDYVEDIDDYECTSTMMTPKAATADTADVLQHCTEALQEPLVPYMSSAVGGTLGSSRQVAVVKRSSTLIAWSSKELAFDIMESPRAVFLWVAIFFSRHYLLLERFCTYLSTIEVLAPTTILNWLNDITYFFKWFAYFSEVGRELAVNPTQLQPILQTIGALRSSLNKSIKTMRSQKTLQQDVERRRRPLNGLKDLQAIVDAKTKITKELPESSFMNHAGYLQLMRLLYASLYTSNSQGRVSGLMDMKYGQREELLISHFAASSRFKTYSKYGYQIVSLAGNSLILFKIFMSYARPYITMKCNITPKDSDPLFITATGTADRNISRHVTEFFRENNLHITTTALRSMVEMEMKDLYDRGQITSAEREAVANTSGQLIKY